MEEFKPGEVERIREKFPGRIPVLVSRSRKGSADIPELKKSKFLVPGDVTIGQFIYIIRRQMALPSEKALFVFVNNTLPTTNSLMSELYAVHKSADGALRITYTSESVFGCTYFRQPVQICRSISCRVMSSSSPVVWKQRKSGELTDLLLV